MPRAYRTPLQTQSHKPPNSINANDLRHASFALSIKTIEMRSHSTYKADASTPKLNKCDRTFNQNHRNAITLANRI
ncbi:MAG: hypothetical protein HC903_14505 [Methylacidiphilales bacterium]|nr:hypothetical protein [Candidatus Methylacidiphilales bacterium]